MRGFCYLFCLILSALLLAPLANAAPTKWKINKYSVVQQAPDETRLPYSVEVLKQQKRDAGTEKGLTTKQMRAVEKYFQDLGIEYQRQGFLEPKIDTLTV